MKDAYVDKAFGIREKSKEFGPWSKTWYKLAVTPAMSDWVTEQKPHMWEYRTELTGHIHLWIREDLMMLALLAGAEQLEVGSY